MQERLAAEGLTITWYEEGYEADVLDRMERLGDVAAFVNVGGNILGMGVNDASLSFGQGLLPESDPRITAKSGLIERYLSLGVPTIHFLNIKQLCAENGIPYDPVSLPEAGASDVYFSRNYSKPLIAAAGAAACLGIVLTERDEKKKKNREA